MTKLSKSQIKYTYIYFKLAFYLNIITIYTYFTLTLSSQHEKQFINNTQAVILKLQKN